jgi:hypothetical protein
MTERFTEDAQERAWEQGFVDKVGGVLVAGNPPFYTECPTCHRPLRFLAQFREDDEFGAGVRRLLDGAAVLHLCEEQHCASLQWIR